MAMREFCNSCEFRGGGFCALPLFEERVNLVGRLVVAGVADSVLRAGSMFSVRPMSADWPVYSQRARASYDERMSEVDLCIAVQRELVNDLLEKE